MKRTLFPLILSIVGMLLASFTFSGKAQIGSPASPAGSELPDALVGFPGVTAEWWAAAQAQLGLELRAQSDLSATPDWSAVGEATSNGFSFSVASAGDVNGDSYADLAVGAPFHDNSIGKVYVYHGSAGGLSLTPDWSTVGEAANNFFGISVASAGDVNGDGYSDLAVGAYSYNGNTGKAYVYYGSAGGLSSSPDWSAVGEASNNYFGSPVASAGDVNEDGYADLAVGAHYYNNSMGKAYVYYGSVGGLSSSADWSFVGEAHGDILGRSVASAGDVNGDGYGDLAIGAERYNNFTGKAYVYHGSASGLSASPDWTAVGEAADNVFGNSVTSAGDVNGDGYADLAVGAFFYNNLKGKAYVYHGSAGGLSSSADWSAVGEAINNWFGYSVASAGDMNGDGFPDLTVGAPNYNTMGKAYVYHGSLSGLSLTADWSAVGESGGSAFGFSQASAGDVNGDGYADLAVGAWGNNIDTGKAYVYHGSAEPASCTDNCLRVASIRMGVDLAGVFASVRIKDEYGAAIPGAVVSAHWDLPNGGISEQTRSTDTQGSTIFRVKGGAGTYVITITNISLSGYTFDPLNSTILSKSITK